MWTKNAFMQETQLKRLEKYSMRGKVLIMHQSQAYAGTDVFALNLIQGLKAEKYSVEVILNEDNKDIKNFYALCATHTYGHKLLTLYGLIGVERFIKKIFIFIFYPFLVSIHLFKLYFKIKKINPDKIIIVNAGVPGGELVYSGALVCGILNIKTIYTIHNDVVYNCFLYPYFYVIEFLLLRFNNIRFISVSEYNVNRVKSRSFFIRDVGLIYNGVGKCDFDFVSESKEGFNIVFVGNFSEQKGVRLLIDAFEAVNKELDCKLFLYGKVVDLALYEYIKSVCGKNNRIEVVVNEHDKRRIFKDKDMLVLPSVRLESFGQVLIEAMSFGVPVLGSNGLGIKEVIEIDERRAGMVFELGSRVDLKRKIEYLIENREMYLAYKTNTLYLFDKYFEKDVMVNKYVEILEGA